MVTGCKERGAVPAHAWISLINESHSFDRQKWRCVIVELVVSIESAEAEFFAVVCSFTIQCRSTKTDDDDYKFSLP